MRRVAVAVTLLLTAVACGGGGGGSKGVAASGKPLVGLFRFAPGQCGSQGISTGSYFRMVQPGGTVAKGPFVINGDSPCADKTWTPLTPGADGGLRTGTYQAQAASPFDSGGNAVTAKITRPQKWFAVGFALATNQRDPQTNAAVPAPRITVSGNSLSGDLSAFAAAWNGQHFNQGSPKPGGSRPGNTTGPRGTYDSAGHTYALDWSSQIVGGPFNNFTGVWHVAGNFQPA